MPEPDQIESPEPVAVREGLPPQYRMRADRHYVDQLAASSGQPVRLIPIAELEAVPLGGVSLQPLLESIRRHGILHPLLVRRTESGYEVIAGRKRLHAASTLQLRVVPCLLQDVSRAEASALAAADNLHIASEDVADKVDFEGLDRLLVSHAAAVRHCAELSGADAPLNAPALDLLRAHAWRTSRLLDAWGFARNASVTSSRERPLVAILADIVDGFGPECRVSGVTIRLEASDGALPAFDEGSILAGVSGALFAMLPLVASANHPTVTVRPSTSMGADVTIQLAQTSSSVPAHVAHDFFKADSSRPGGITAAVGALAARALARAHRGQAVFESLPQGGRLSISMERSS